MEVLASQSPKSDMKLRATNVGTRQSRGEAVDVDGQGTSSCSGERDYDMQNLEPVYNNELGDHVEPLISNLSDSTRDTNMRDLPINGFEESFGCSYYEVHESECIELPPASFEFHVRSEEGINLYVDLNSSTSDWFKKREVCIQPKMLNRNSRVLHHELKIFGESDEQLKASFLGNAGISFQTRGGPQCTESSISSVVRETDHFGVDHSDFILRFSAITPSNDAVEISSLVRENDRKVSSLCKPHPDLQLQDSIDLSSESYLRIGGKVTLGSEVPTVSQTTSFTDSRLAASLFDISENQSMSDSICQEDAKTVPMWASVPSESDLSMFTKFFEDRIPPNTTNLENPVGVFNRYSTSDSPGIQLSEVASYCGQPDFCHPMTYLRTENGGSENYNLDQNTCGDPLYASSKEWEGSNPVNERESSQCSQMLKRTCKRSDSAEPEGPQSKRQSTSSENQDTNAKPTRKNLRNATKHARKVLPRRSSRLVSK